MRTPLYSTKKLVSNTVEESWLLEPMAAILTDVGGSSREAWQHLGRVARYAVRFGRELGLDNEELMCLQCAALLHDVGKLALPPALLNKSTPLERDEWYSITKHSVAASKILKERTLHPCVISAAQAQHERYDGTGYPLGLAGEAIPLTARVLSIADAYDSMSSDRPYRPALEHGQMLDEIGKGAGKQFDPTLVEKLWPLIEAGAEEGATKHLRVVSDDPILHRQMWIAAYPHGWEVQAWPLAWTSYYPAELTDDAPDNNKSSEAAYEPVTINTVVDGRCVKKIPSNVLSRLPNDALWVDPTRKVPKGVYTPLDLRDILGSLYGTGKEAWATSPNTKIRVVIADPYHLFRQVLKRCLAERDDVEVVAEVDSPQAYRRALSQHEFDLAILASDLLNGTHTTSPLKRGDQRLQHNEFTAGDLRSRPTIVLVADEDVKDYDVALYDAPITGKLDENINCLFIHRGAPAERLIEAMKSVMKTVMREK